jgi:hypothetical protein
LSFSFRYGNFGMVAYIQQLLPWQIAVALTVSGTGFVLFLIIGRAIFFAVNPDKKPRKRKRASGRIN